ncbi:MAG TPA: crotonase/enoyl-CoA hydratase family protein, partial [Candidatus Binatia bacterium]|nr:crotonase/enoyl-CoA hydratase family protein [Candidatus Binatia bacterium]
MTIRKSKKSRRGEAGTRPPAAYETLLYDVDGTIATITLNRPDRLNTIVPPMPDEIEAAVHRAVADRAVKVIIVRGAGRAFCAGFDFGGGFHHWDEALTTDGAWDPGKDFVFATAPTLAPVPKFMSLWRAPKPVIAQVHGWCVGGGSDFALCADLVIASDDARIGTPYSRMWGCYLSGMWLYRLGLTKAKEYALTGKPLSGSEAAAIGLINKAVPFAQLEAEVRASAEQLASIPLSQLSAMKLIVNQAYENMGLASTQTLGPILDGLMRNTPGAH